MYHRIITNHSILDPMKFIPYIFGFLLGLCFLASYGFTTLPEESNPKNTVIQKLPSEMENFLPASVVFPLEKGHIPTENTEATTTPPFVGHSYTGFKEALAFKESRGRYGIVNTLGYIGKYQFGIGTLALLGRFNKDQFLHSPELQERVFDANIARNKWILRRDIKRFTGTVIQGILISESGILAAAHLAGAGNVKKYLRSNGAYQVADAYGTTIAGLLNKLCRLFGGGYSRPPKPQSRNFKELNRCESRN